VRYGLPIATAAASILLVYFFVGLNKLLLSGPAWFLSDNLRWVLYETSAVSTSPSELALFIADRPLLARASAASVLLLELSAPIAYIRLGYARVFPWLISAVHLTIWISMGLNYSSWIITVVSVVAVYRRSRAFHTAPSVPTHTPVTLLFDSDCGFCTWLVMKIVERSLGRVRPVPIGTEHARRLTPHLSEAERRESWHLVVGSRVLSGGDVFRPLLHVLPGAAVARALLMPIPRFVLRRGYRWLAAHRHWLGRVMGEAACGVPGSYDPSEPLKFTPKSRG
jgi:predicted DCC family thiol-disulfide oxidoreductase YuxK